MLSFLEDKHVALLLREKVLASELDININDPSAPSSDALLGSYTALIKILLLIQILSVVFTSQQTFM